MVMFCSNCGKQLAEDVRFCSECGTAVATTPYKEIRYPSGKVVKVKRKPNEERTARKIYETSLEAIREHEKQKCRSWLYFRCFAALLVVIIGIGVAVYFAVTQGRNEGAIAFLVTLVGGFYVLLGPWCEW